MRSEAVDLSVPATSVMVDLRNFTPNFDAARVDGDGASEFCSFLAEFYTAVVHALVQGDPLHLADVRQMLAGS